MPRTRGSWIDMWTTVSCAILLAALVGCTRGSEPKPAPPDLATLAVDPLACTTLTLKREIKLQQEVISEPSVMEGWVIMALRYREGGGEREYDPKLSPGYTNVSVFIEVKQSEQVPLVVYRDFSVVEIWRLDGRTHTKLCCLWTINRNEASLRLMLEDFGRTLLAERNVPLNDEQVAQLKAFHHHLLARFLEMLRNPPRAA